jgi:two-component system phosphate regulon response regulator PhoB
MKRPLVYVVDDDDFIREAISDALVDGGYEVHAYRNGREAVRALEASEVPSLILLDWMMPVMSGAEFIREEQALVKRKEIPVVVVSAVADRIGEIPAVQEKIRKPVELGELLEAVRRHCAHRAHGEPKNALEA